MSSPDELFAGFEEFMVSADLDMDYFEEQAWFCLITGISPEVYDNMTKPQIQAFIKVQNKINQKRSKG